MASPAQYAASAGLRVVPFDDESVVFHPKTWSSHVLNGSAAAVLEFVIERSRSRGEIETLLARLLDPTEQPSLPRHVDGVIENLRLIDLIHEA